MMHSQQHLDDATLRNLQNESALKTASSHILKTAKSLYQFIVPVAQLNLSSQGSALLPHQEAGGIEPMDAT